jgi:hypothetical protein
MSEKLGLAQAGADFFEKKKKEKTALAQAGADIAKKAAAAKAEAGRVVVVEEGVAGKDCR